MDEGVGRPGGCQCGAVRYTLRNAQREMWACHCKECQKQSGSAFGLSLPTPRADLEITGDLATYRRPTESGSFTTGYFCPKCGSRILHVSDRSPDNCVLKAGTLDDTSDLVVGRHIFTERAHPWLNIIAGRSG